MAKNTRDIEVLRQRLDEAERRLEAIEHPERRIVGLTAERPGDGPSQGISAFDAAGAFVGLASYLKAAAGVTFAKSGKYITVASSGGGGGAPATASYIVLGTDATLTAERVLTEGAGIVVTDGGAGGALTIAARIREIHFSLGEIFGYTV